MRSDRIDRISSRIQRLSKSEEPKVVSDKIPMRGVLAAHLNDGEACYVSLMVPDEFAKSVFEAIKKPGMEIGFTKAHISVFTLDEIEQIGYIDELGQEFEYTLGPIVSCNPDSWDEMEKVYFIECKSLELEKLRISYGLTSKMYNKHEFHITIAVVQKG